MFVATVSSDLFKMWRLVTSLFFRQDSGMMESRNAMFLSMSVSHYVDVK